MDDDASDEAEGDMDDVTPLRMTFCYHPWTLMVESRRPVMLTPQSRMFGHTAEGVPKIKVALRGSPRKDVWVFGMAEILEPGMGQERASPVVDRKGPRPLPSSKLQDFLFD
ncbi:hypothetical protein NDU88_001056 [Pleurodeles waltl]|uniref:Uncharacterized protein n=1 Tax=Pleurodeles waltl TaxID=8319 RepID=A0AAV7URQ8_PLEWA|nr:hypothetical protein NDU88_001055 [Pleurodeles waltl]KAJ1191740.1 hypothetical protein NDU88_001056 [Pleurodeles waltl]